MPSELEKLVKILKLEQDTHYQDKAVIGGLHSFAKHWAPDARAQARKPEHHQLIDELVGLMTAYAEMPADERHQVVKYMLGRMTNRIPPPAAPPAPEAMQAASSPPSPMILTAPVEPPPAVSAAAPVEAASQAPERASSDQEPEAPAGQPVDTGVAQGPAGSMVQTSETQESAFRPDQEQIPAPEPAAATLRSGALPRRRRAARTPEREAEIRRELEAPVTSVEGVGPKIAEKLAELGIQTIRDWLYCFPRRYDDYSRMMSLNRLQPDMTVTVIGTVRQAAVIKGRRNLESLNVTITDGTGTLTASFFGQPYLRSTLEPGARVVFSGKTGLYGGRITMDNPEWEFVEQEALHTRGIVPVYPLTKGLTAHSMRRLSHKMLDRYAQHVPDYMPEAVLDRMDLPDLAWALRQMHLPDSDEMLAHARRRLAFDELILLQLAVLGMRREWQSAPGIPMLVTDEWLDALTSSLPYALTGAQRRAVAAIREDMARPVPMNRLLQGDVGAGKTVVAAIAMRIAVANGCQAAIMAPTGILAEQHYQSLSRLLAEMPDGDSINVRLLTSATPPQARAEILWGLGEGSVQVVIGTHALLQDDVNFWRLGMVVVDEQHRFGVEQRGALRGKGVNPHLLVMTATPIPRTLALTLHADLDLTVLDEMPPGRTPVKTMVMFAKERERIYRFLEAQTGEGRQAFIVYPLVESSERESMADVRPAVQEFERLQAEVFPNRRLGLLHGRLSAAQKDAVMAAFSRGELDILVSTTVVEVGIDVPNATVMLVEGANRFGLAPLHQLRGRVGRGEFPSYCLLIPDDGDMDNTRLRAMESTTDGFRLAEMDWRLRGAGDLLGVRQSGGRKARLSPYITIDLVEAAQVEARTLYEEDPTLSAPEHQALRDQIRRTFGEGNMADVS
jgi:ATP-dependent DNA helicase RecG